ncbi:MAG: KH domain-containing protein [Armatimonadota bacterium]|nr:KH domain-containing protein [Armatimonadota bacterium]
MRELVELMVRSLVDEPEQARINEVAGESIVVYEVSVAESDLGKVIGKGGRIANAMRTIVKAAATKMDRKATVEILS